MLSYKKNSAGEGNENLSGVCLVQFVLLKNTPTIISTYKTTFDICV